MDDDVYQIKIATQIGNERVETIYAVQDGIGGTANPEAVATAILTAWQTTVLPAWRAVLPTDAKVLGVSCRRVNNTGGPSSNIIFNSAPGTYPADSSVTSSGAVLIGPYHEVASTPPRFRTSRMFVPGLPEGAMESNQLVTEYADLVRALSAALLLPLTTVAGDANLCVWSRKYNNAYVIGVLYTSSVVGTQRRRLTPVI